MKQLKHPKMLFSDLLIKTSPANTFEMSFSIIRGPMVPGLRMAENEIEEQRNLITDGDKS
jgi:hypothetical protein